MCWKPRVCTWGYLAPPTRIVNKKASADRAELMMASYVASPEAEVQEVHYKQLLDNIGAQLDTNAVNFLITLHNLPVITAQGLDPEPFHVLQSMEEKGILSSTNLKTLSISLKRVGKKNLIEMIKKYESNCMSASDHCIL